MFTDGEQEKNQQAKAERMRLQLRQGGDQRPYAGGDAYRRRQYVVDHQRGGGQQAGVIPQILRRHRVGSPALGISLDGLTIGEIHDDQQHDDGRDHRENVVDSKQPQRDQQRESSFRTVCRRAQGIQSKDGDAGRRADLLPVLLPVGQRTPDEDVEN